LQEEMMRVKAFFRAQAEMWDQWVTGSGARTDLDHAVRRGMEAYAREQAAQFRAMRGHCEHAWRFIDDYVTQFGQQQVVPIEMDSKLMEDDE
jgi:hypothetical protein